MGSREAPFEEDARCDSCGHKGAFDFMGDYLCASCAFGHVPPTRGGHAAGADARLPPEVAAASRERSLRDENELLAAELRDREEEIEALEAELARWKEIARRRGVKVRKKMVKLKEVANRRLAPYHDQLRGQGHRIEVLKGEKAQLEAELERLREGQEA